jgi:enamine deaminase RidA (YjgF/YER057c/UK114 family)
MFELIQPNTRHEPSGYTHGIVIPPASSLMYISGQLASDRSGKILSDDLAHQFLTCLDNVLLILKSADASAGPKAIAKLTVFITDFNAYRSTKQSIAVGWNARFGKYYPSISIVEVNELIDPDAKVEIEAVAVVRGIV